MALLIVLSAGAQDKLIFTQYQFNAPTLESMSFDGTDLTTLFDAGTPFPITDWLTVGLALDDASATSQIYWTHGSFNAGRIRRAALNGASQQLLLSGLKNPRGLALDAASGKLYWTNSPATGNASGIIERANLDGSSKETFFALTPYDPSFSKVGRPTVDAQNGYLYFGANSRVLRVHLDDPNRVEVVADGGSTITRVQLDVASGHLYWVDSDTISDALVRVDLDNRNFTVLFYGGGGSSGLTDLALDLSQRVAFITDEIGAKGVYAVDLDTAAASQIHVAPPDKNPSAIILDASQTQALLDCNGNGIRDADDIAAGAPDCNGNGIPDGCEGDPCATPVYLLNQPLDPNATTQVALGGTVPGTGWEIFQPFDVPAGGWSVSAIEINGRTNAYHPDLAGVALFPDDGTGTFADEGQPLAAGALLFRFGFTWERAALAAKLAPGRYWIRLQGNSGGAYAAAVSRAVASSGLPATSRSNLGNLFLQAQPIALRIVPAAPCAADLSGDGQIDQNDLNLLLADFNCSGGGCSEDIDGDGNTDQNDLNLLLAAFGTSC